MTFIEFFKQQFIEEGNTTRKMLSRIPHDQFGYQPHPKSMDMKRLATHIADLPGWIHMTFTTDEIDFAKPYEQPSINTHEDLMDYFEKRYQDGLSTLVPENEKLLNKPWTLRNGDTIYSYRSKDRYHPHVAQPANTSPRTTRRLLAVIECTDPGQLWSQCR